MHEWHRYIAGQTGTGKSTFMEHAALAAGGGFCFIDPHGPSALALANATSCIYFDPLETPLTLNILENVAPAQRHRVAEELSDILEAIWSDSWGPRMASILYHAIRVVLDNHGSLTDIYKLLTDERYRTRCLIHASFPDFWTGEFNEWNKRDRDTYIQPVLNKLGRFNSNPILSKILGSKHSTLNVSRILARGDKLVVNLDKSKLGPETSNLLGAFTLSAFAQAAFQRDPSNTTPYFLFVDEFHNFTTKHFDLILSEVRKYKLYLTIANQYLEQLDPRLQAAVFGNVPDITCFRVGAKDAEIFAKQLDLAPRLLYDLPNFQARRKRPPLPANAELVRTLPPAPGRGRLPDNVKNTRANYVR